MPKQSLSILQNAASEAVKVIALASSDAATKLAAAASEATRVIANAASEALKVKSIKDTEDHDLLKSVDLRLGILQITVDKISSRDETYVVKVDYIKENADHETRIRGLEQQRWLWAGALLVLVFISPIVFNWISNLIKVK